MEREALEFPSPRLRASARIQNFFSFVPSCLRVYHSSRLRTRTPAFAGERGENPVLQPRTLPKFVPMTINRLPPTRADGPVSLANLTKPTQIASGRINIVRLSAVPTNPSHGVIRP